MGENTNQLIARRLKEALRDKLDIRAGTGISISMDTADALRLTEFLKEKA